MKTDHSASWFCAQIGAREHYAIPRALHHAGRLDTLYTDFYAGPVTRPILRKSRALGSLASRFHLELGTALIRSWNLRSVAWEVRLRRKSREGGERYLGYCDVGHRFACAVREDFKSRALSPETIFFAYDTGALEAFQFLRSRGARCVLDQMDPNRVEVDLVQEEEKRWPGWALHPVAVPEEYFRRREEEWNLADRIVVNSNFSREALIRQGVPAEKLVVIPLCYEAGNQSSDATTPSSFSSQKPLQVLFLGQVILRKGISYLIEAARLLRDAPVHFQVVGPIGISDDAVRSAPSNVTFHGRAGRDQAAGWYRQCDLFVLPTISDGFAITQIEAMAHGLPVVATGNCGEVVTDGADGWIVPPRDSEALAKAVIRYLENPGLLQDHAAAARRKAGQFTLARLTENLAALQRQLQS